MVYTVVPVYYENAKANPGSIFKTNSISTTGYRLEYNYTLHKSNLKDKSELTTLSNKFDLIFKFKQSEWFYRIHYYTYLGFLNIISIIAYFIAAGILIVRFAKKHISEANTDTDKNRNRNEDSDDVVIEQEMLAK